MRGLNSGLVTSLSLLLLAAGALPAAEHRHHGVHEHGAAHLDLVIEGGALHLELVIPAGDLVGFERHPVSEAERAALERAAATLREGERLFRLPADAGCRLDAVALESPLLDPEDAAAESSHHHEDESGHADVHASYRFRCTSPAGLSGVEIGLFDAFPSIQRLETQLVTDRAQRAETVTPVAPRLKL